MPDDNYLLPSRYAEDRMRERGISIGHVDYAIKHHDDTYEEGADKVYVSKLPDERHIHVRVKEIGFGITLIINALIFQID